MCFWETRVTAGGRGREEGGGGGFFLQKKIYSNNGAAFPKFTHGQIFLFGKIFRVLKIQTEKIYMQTWPHIILVHLNER